MISNNGQNLHVAGNYFPCAVMANPGILGNTIEEKTRAILGWTNLNPNFGPDKVKRRKSSTCPYDSTSMSRKSSASSVTNEFSQLLVSHELTPPPSPIIRNHQQIVTSFSNQPPPPPYCGQYLDNESHQNTHFPISPVSPIFEEDTASKTINAREIFERLRAQMPRLSKEQSKFRLLLQTVANVIELETKLVQLHEETQSLTNIIQEKRKLQQLKVGMGADTSGSNGTPNQSWVDPQQSGSLGTLGPNPTSQDVPDDLQEIDLTAFRCLVSENHTDSGSNGKIGSAYVHSSDLLWNNCSGTGDAGADISTYCPYGQLNRA